MATSGVSSSTVSGSDLLMKLGAGSGTNTKSLAESLVDAERQPRADAINARMSKAQNRVSGLSAVMLSLDTIKKSFQSLDDPSDWAALNIQSSQSAAVTATATGAAAAGSHTVEVLSLAVAQRDISGGFAASDTQLNGGNAFSLQLAVNGGAAKTIRVPAASATPAGMVAAINGARLGLTAQLVNTNDGSANPYKIIVNGTSGAANAFTLTTDNGGGSGEQQTMTFGPATASGRISVQGVLVDVSAGDSAAAVSAKVKAALDASSFITGASGRTAVVNADGTLTLNYAAADGDMAAPAWGDVGGTGVTATYVTNKEFVAGAAVSGVSFTRTGPPAADAKVAVDGLIISRSTNTITDAIPGLTLNLLNTTSPAATLDLTRDASKLKEKVQALVKSFNDAMSDFKILSGPKNKDDETDVYSGSLANDATLSGIRMQLRSLFISDSSTPGTNANALRDMGVSIQRDGTLELDETKFDNAVKDNFGGLVTMFTADRENKGTMGTAKRGLGGDAVKRLTDLMSKSGLLMAQSESSQQQVTRYKNDLARLETRMEALLARYSTQFASMDAIVGNANSMKTYLKNQFDAMSGSSS